MKHIAFIGAGNMGGALVRGACKALDPQEVLIYEPSQKAAAALSAETGCQVAASGAQAVREARYVMLCVKPQVLEPVLEWLLPALREGAQAVCLVKPQFEAGREKVGKKGVVRDPAVHLEVLEHFLDHAREAGFSVKDITFSPITGPEGNIEYLGWLGTEGEGPVWSGDLRELVEESHRSLQGK